MYGCVCVCLFISTYVSFVALCCVLQLEGGWLTRGWRFAGAAYTQKALHRFVDYDYLSLWCNNCCFCLTDVNGESLSRINMSMLSPLGHLVFASAFNHKFHEKDATLQQLGCRLAESDPDSFCLAVCIRVQSHGKKRCDAKLIPQQQYQ